MKFAKPYNPITFCFLLFMIGFLLNPNIGKAQHTGEKGILWEVRGKKSKKISYLYGTIHIKDKRVFAFDDIVIQSLNKCELFMPEMSLQNVDMAKMAKAMYTTDSLSLDKLLSAEDYQLLKDTVKKRLQSGIKPYKKMKPFFLMSLLTNDLFSQDETSFLDNYLLALAEKHKKSVEGLETLDDQLSCIERISLEDQCKWLMMLIKDTSAQKDQSEEMVEIYLSGYLSDFDTLDISSYGEDFFNIFLTERNLKMADKIDQTIKKQTAFVAVGAMHLTGNNGLISLLRQKGYEVKAIPFEFNKP